MDRAQTPAARSPRPAGLTALAAGVLILTALAGAAWLLAAALPSRDAGEAAAMPGQEDAARLILTGRDRRTIALPGGERREISSLLRVPAALRFGMFRWNEADAPPAPAWVLVDLQNQTMSVFRGGHEIGTSVVLYGADSHPTPLGRFAVLAKLRDHRSSIYDAEMPFTLRLTHDGIAIHGSNVRRGLATHGCIGIPSAFAARLFDAVKPGDPVFILRALPAGDESGQ